MAFKPPHERCGLDNASGQVTPSHSPPHWQATSRPAIRPNAGQQSSKFGTNAPQASGRGETTFKGNTAGKKPRRLKERPGLGGVGTLPMTRWGNKA